MNKLKGIRIASLFCLTIMIVSSCGDIFARRRHIVGNYYLYEEDGVSDYSISYKLTGGDYIGRVTAPVVEYGWVDSILVAKTKRDTTIEVYIINMNTDSEFADPQDYMIKTLTEEEFKNYWQNKFNIRFKKI